MCLFAFVCVCIAVNDTLIHINSWQRVHHTHFEWLNAHVCMRDILYIGFGHDEHTIECCRWRTYAWFFNFFFLFTLSHYEKRNEIKFDNEKYFTLFWIWKFQTVIEPTVLSHDSYVQLEWEFFLSVHVSVLHYIKLNWIKCHFRIIPFCGLQLTYQHFFSLLHFFLLSLIEYRFLIRLMINEFEPIQNQF